MTEWSEPSHAVRIFSSELGVTSFARQARDAGARVVVLDVADSQTDQTLLQQIAESFEFDDDNLGADATVDEMAGLEWMPSTAGYLVVIRGLDDCAPSAARLISDMIPSVVERWVSKGVVYVVAMITVARRVFVNDTLKSANARLDRSARLEWNIAVTGSVPIIDQS